MYLASPVDEPSNRRMRTRLSGGVGGEARDEPALPYPDTRRTYVLALWGPVHCQRDHAKSRVHRAPAGATTSRSCDRRGGPASDLARRAALSRSSQYLRRPPLGLQPLRFLALARHSRVMLRDEDAVWQRERLPDRPRRL